MKKSKKLKVWILGSIPVLLFLAGILILLGPRLVNFDAAKREIADRLSRRVGGRIDLKGLRPQSLPASFISEGPIQIGDDETGLDLAVFAAPFKTADRILRMLPVIGYILDDTLVSIAVRVTGDVKNPKIDYLPDSMLESGLIGIMKRTLKAPVKVLTPMMPK